MAGSRRQEVNAGEDVEKRDTHVLGVGTEIGAATLKSCMEVPQKLKTE